MPRPPPVTTATLPSTRKRSSIRSATQLGFDLVEGLGERVPRECGALDAHRELHHPLQRLEVAEVDLFDRLRIRFGLGLAAVAADSVLVDRHHRLERAD